MTHTPDRREYHVLEPDSGWRQLHTFSEQEKQLLRPIAETLAMLDGNAFFTHECAPGCAWYEQYLPEADAVYQSNGGAGGWASCAQFAQMLTHENQEVADAYHNWITLKQLYRGAHHD